MSATAAVTDSASRDELETLKDQLRTLQAHKTGTSPREPPDDSVEQGCSRVQPDTRSCFPLFRDRMRNEHLDVVSLAGAAVLTVSLSLSLSLSLRAGAAVGGWQC